MTPDAGPSPAADAAAAARLLAVDPAGLGGAVLRAGPGPARDRWLALLAAALPAGTPMRRLPAGVPDSRLLGGLDVAATLAAGRRVVERGLLAEADGGILLAAMAERLEPGTAARLAAALDDGEVSVQREGVALTLPARIAVVALDEGIAAEEAPPAPLADRLAFALRLDDLPPADLAAWAPPARVDAARARLPRIPPDDRILEALVKSAAMLGIAGIRAPLLALRAARAAAALAGRDRMEEADAALAVRLVLAPRATQLPAEAPTEDPPPPEPPPPEPDQNQAQDQTPPDPGPDQQQMQEMLLAAARAALPSGLLATLDLREQARRAAGASGKAGARRQAARHGRPIGTRAALPRSGQKIALVETLRAAAPWQAIRRRERPIGPRLRVLREDIRIRRFKERIGTTAVFVVDASGSSALNRLAEAKGAVEMLLAECYIRRDQVAVVAFRNRGAEVLLPPTSSLVRAKRSLAGLPGGGATPLAAGLDAAAALAREASRRGRTPLLVLLTDGRANIARDGTPGRPKAEADGLDAAAALRMLGIPALVVDTAPRPQPYARKLAEAMAGRYLPLPATDAARLSAAVAGVRDAA